jgi:hypothetical protein
MKKMISRIGVIVLSIGIISTAYSDELSRQQYEAAYAAYQLELSARLLEQTVKNYSPLTNPNGAATVLTAFDQLANDYIQASLPIGNYMNTVKQANPKPHQYYDAADQVLLNLEKAVQSVSMLQTVSRGAASASLSSYSHLSDINHMVSHAGAITYVSTVISNLTPSGISETEVAFVQTTIYETAQQAALHAMNQKAGNSTVIPNSEVCMAAAGAIATFSIRVEGAIALALQQKITLSAAYNLVLSDSTNNPLTVEQQQQSYSITFSAIFAGTFSALINQSALQPYNSPVHRKTMQTNADLLIQVAKELAKGVSKMIMPDMSTNIVDALNYASLQNSGLLNQRHFELRDLIFIMQELSGKIQ